MSTLPVGWIAAKLGDVASTQLGRMLAAHRETGKSGKPYLRNRDVQWGQISVSDLPTMDFGPEEQARYALTDGDLLVCEGGEVGRAALWTAPIPECYFQKALHRVRAAPGVSNRFLRYLLEHYARADLFVRFTTGTTIAHIPQEDLRLLPVPLPPTVEQERIVAAIEDLFSQIDAGRTSLERARRNLRRLRLELMSGLADTASQWTTLGAIAEIVGGVTKDSKRQSDRDSVEVPYLRVANVQRGYLDLGTVTTIRVPAKKADQLYLQPGDILFNEGGDRDKLGRGWIWQGEIPNCIHQNHVFRARVDQRKFEPKFVSIHGNTFGQKWFEEMGRQTTNLASLNMTTLKSFPVPVLPLDEQRALVAALDRQASEIAALAAALDVATRRSDRLRTSIFAAAFSGNLVPQDHTDEHASVLLDRITAERASLSGHTPIRSRRLRAKVTV